jgi:heat shock protein HslJ
MARTGLLLAVFLLTGCAGGPAGGATTDDVAGEWDLVSGTAAGAALPQPSGASATLLFDGTQAGGRSFCNLYGTGYSLDGDTIRFEGFSGTEMACEPAVMTAERAYLSALGAVDRVAMDGGDLLLTGDDVELRFEPVPPVPTSALVETEWVLETVLDGDLASSTLGEPATLNLADDGTMTGSTGCRTLTGTWETRGGTVVLPDLAADGECPDDLRTQDDQVVTVLGDGFRASIVEDRLTLSDPDGRGLVYLAAT